MRSYNRSTWRLVYGALGTLLQPWNILFFFFLAMSRGLWDLSSPTRDRTPAPGSGSMENRRTILKYPLRVRDFNVNVRCFLQKLFGVECRSTSEDFC